MHGLFFIRAEKFYSILFFCSILFYNFKIISLEQTKNHWDSNDSDPNPDTELLSNQCLDMVNIIIQPDPVFEIENLELNLLSVNFFLNPLPSN